MFDYKQYKAMERIRKNYTEQRKQAETEAAARAKTTPTVTIKERNQIESMIEKIRSFAEYTFAYEKAVGNEELKYKERGDLSRPLTIWINPGTYSISHYEHANREVLRLKKSIRNLLRDYEVFRQEFPDPDNLGATKMNKEFYYQKLDPFVTNTKKEIEELRCYGEQVAYEMKQEGVNMAYALGVSEKELNG